jgi:hypothetical protein
MDQRIPDVVSFPEIKIVLKIVSDATCALPPDESLSPEIRRFDKRRNSISAKCNIILKVLLVSIGLLFIAVGLVAVFESSAIMLSIETLGVLTIVGSLVVVVLMLAANLPYIQLFFKEPYSFFLAAVESSAVFDIQFVNRLALCKKDAVKYVLTYYRYERAGLEKRGGTIAGSIEKIGLFPALAAVIALWYAFSENKLINEWLPILAPMILVFHIINFIVSTKLQRMDRIIEMLELSLDLRD